MRNRIYTPDQQENWRKPKSESQYKLTIASKEFIESLSYFRQVRQLLAKGERPRDVAVLIQQNNEFPKFTFESIKKYAQVYRSFFVSKGGILRTHAAEQHPKPSTIIKNG